MRFQPQEDGVSVVPPPPGTPNVPVSLAVVEFPNEFLIGPNDSRRELKTIDSCIYCGATGVPLSEEHFVSEGLGSRLVLLKASCQRCAIKTSAIERMVLHQSLLVPRVRMGIRRKKRKRNESLFPVPIGHTDGRNIVHTTLDNHPSVLFMPVFNAPGLTVDRPVGSHGIQGAHLQMLTELPKPEFSEFASPSVDTAAFCQLLAKIAHGFAVLELGIDGFEPLLPEIILKDYGGDNSFSWFHLIGGDPRSLAPSEALHVLGWGFFEKVGTEYLIVSLRLLANAATPIYYAVAGTLTPEQSARAHALEEARAGTRGTTYGQSR
jgi:hypothetical protein